MSKHLLPINSGSLSLRDAMNRLFDDAFLAPFNESVLGPVSNKLGLWPRVNISDNERQITITANIPGMTADDVDVSIDNGVLSISGEVKKETEDKNDTYYRVERESGSFARSFSLPSGINEDDISAEVKNGVLIVVVPKKEVAETKKKVQIKS